MDLRAAFVRFRGGNGFVYSLCAFVAGWFALRAVFGFDQDYGLLNLVLSCEASFATCFLIDQQSKQAEQDRKMLIEILRMARADTAQLSEILETVEAIEGEVLEEDDGA